MIGIAPAHPAQAGNYTSWLDKRNIPYKVLTPGEKLTGCTMLLLCGGPDVGKSPERDSAEIAWFKEAYNNMPILGICRGLQISNVILGGTLYDNLSETKIQHAANKTFAGEPHAQIESSWHDVIFTDGKRIKVNSRHHQGIDRLAEGLKVLATCSEDEVLEMVEGNNALFVQWHPERPDVWGTDAENVVNEWLQQNFKPSTEIPPAKRVDNPVEKITQYMRRKGFTVVSNDGIRSNIDPSYSDSFLNNLVQENRFSMKRVIDKHGRLSLKMLKL